MAAANQLKLRGVLKVLSDSFPCKGDSIEGRLDTDVLLLDVGGW